MLIRVTPDKEKVKSMLSLIKQREEFVHSIDINKFSTIATEEYYEIVKELIIALLLLDGFKTTGEYAHKELIDYLSSYNEFKVDERILIDDLRIKRNKSSYEGKAIESAYLNNKKKKLLNIIQKLKNLLKNKLI